MCDARDGPAFRGGAQRGDGVVGVGELDTKNLAELFDNVWAQGAPSVQVKMKTLIDSGVRDMLINTVDQHDFLRQQTAQYDCAARAA